MSGLSIQLPDEALDAALARVIDAEVHKRLLRLKSLSTETAARLLDFEEPAFRALCRRKGVEVEVYSQRQYRIPLPAFEELKANHLLKRKPTNKRAPRTALTASTAKAA